MRVVPAVGMLCALLLASSVAAQEKLPKRPALAPGADTLSANAYYQLGVAVLEENPGKAAEAFYWAQRLDPTWPDAPYARRIALLGRDPFTLGRYYDGDERLIRSAKIAKLDSLQLRAFQLNPFLYQRLEQRMFLMYLRFLIERDMRAEGDSRPLAMS